jgi:hypothetical protein
MLIPYRIRTVWLPLGGVGLFLAAYFYAAARYPGGTQLDPRTTGYSHLANYWCDLLDAVTYAGRPNPGRPVALAATIVLPLALIPLWRALPRLFGSAGAPKNVIARTVRLAGPLAMLAAALVFTRFHDLAIDVGAVTGGAAFLAAQAGLVRGRRRTLVATGLVAVCFAVANYALWTTRAVPVATPAVQKAAYAAFLLWVVLVAAALLPEAQ